MFESDVWNRTGANEMSKQAYAFLLAAFTAIGIAFCAAASTLSHDWDLKSWSLWQFIGFFVGILVAAIAGSVIANKSDNPIISSFGFTLVAGPFGLMLGPVVAEYTTASVLRVLTLTVLMTVTLGVVGAVTPKDLSSWANWLFGGLLILLLGLFAVPIMSVIGLPVDGAMTFLDWAGLVLFGAFVIFDLNRAMRIPYTLDNAIDCALAVFVDMVNIFIRLLAIMGDSSSD